MFRGREQHRPELGYRLLQKLAADLFAYTDAGLNALVTGKNLLEICDDC